MKRPILIIASIGERRFLALRQYDVEKSVSDITSTVITTIRSNQFQLEFCNATDVNGCEVPTATKFADFSIEKSVSNKKLVEAIVHVESLGKSEARQEWFTDPYVLELFFNEVPKRLPKRSLQK